MPNARRKVVQLPTLNTRDQSGPKDRPAAEVQLRLFADVALGAVVPGLPECVAAEVSREAVVGNAGDVVDVGGIEERSSLQHGNSFLRTEPVRKIISQHPAADPRADDDDVKIFEPADVLKKQTFSGGRVFRDEIYIGRGDKSHGVLPSLELVVMCEGRLCALLNEEIWHVYERGT
jgi:hypothetical protein